MHNLRWSIHYSSFPITFDPHLARYEEIHSLAMPQIVMPFSLIHLSSCSIVVDSESVLHLIDEGAFVLIPVEEGISALDEGRWVEGFAFKAIAVGVLDDRWLMG